MSTISSLGATAPKNILLLIAVWILIPEVLSSDSQTNTIVPHHADKRSEKVLPTDFATNPLLRTKRAEIDLQTCIDNFNVHRDKIIRTQDSQNMGAKYLNEIDLGSREECLRLCCETEDCDVFVFEEKNSGSCYLFHCGPPEDFKCKFTHHVNYSSAVLSINRHLPDLESQIKLTKHVKDLTKLRKPDSDLSDVLKLNPVAAEVIKPAPSTTLAPVITKEVLPVEKQAEASATNTNTIYYGPCKTTKAEKASKTKIPDDFSKPLMKNIHRISKNIARKCSRYQFECRSTGECIAIYNACDGIPQCADGSDEAHELGCPAPEAVAGAAAQPTPSPTPNKIVQSSPHQPQAVVQQYGREGELVQQQPRPQPGANYQTLYHPQPQMSQMPVQPDADFLRPVADPRSPGRAQFEPILQVPNYLGLPGNWGLSRQQSISQQGMQQVPQLTQYQDSGNPVYSHKEKASHNEGQLSQIQYPEYAGRVPNYYGENYRQPIQQENWPVDETRYQPQQQYHSQENPAPMVPAKTEGTSHIADPLPQVVAKPSASDTGADSDHVQEKLAHDLKHSKDNMEHGSSQKVKVKPETLPHQEQFTEPYKMSDDTQDGLSHIPRGAILSLTLGLIITGVMAILIGCRLRVVRRRLRKGGKGYAHDADYLVNGMYL